MKCCLQWTQKNPTDYLELDSSQWSAIPKRPIPGRGEKGGQDEQEGWVFALSVQGSVFLGYDHYAVEDLSGGACRVTAWKDDPDDLADDVLGEFYTRVWTFRPLAPDPRLGGAWNTRQSQVVYVGPKLTQYYADREVENIVVKPWSQFVPPPATLTRHGIWTTDALMVGHDVARVRKTGWRWYTDGVPARLVKNGELVEQRPLGLYNKPKGTKTFFLRDTTLDNPRHVADFENVMSPAAGGGELQKFNLSGGSTGNFQSQISPSGEPNQLTWPVGDYRCQLDMTDVGVDITYGLRTHGAGHFARLRNDLSTHINANIFPQIEALFSGTGLKLATTGTVDFNDFGGPNDPELEDRLELIVADERAASHGNQPLEIRFSSDCWADGPWTTGATNFTKALTEDISGLTDTIARVAAYVRATAEDVSSSFADSIGRVFGAVRPLAEDVSATFVDAVSRVVGAVRPLIEDVSATFTDSVNRTAARFRTLTEDISATFADAIARTLGGVTNFTRNLAEDISGTFSDAAIRAWNGVRNLNENVSASFVDAVNRLCKFWRRS